MKVQQIPRSQAVSQASTLRPSAIPVMGQLRLRLRSRLSFAVTVFLMVIILIAFPRLPIGTGDDSSWTSVLGYAYHNGLQFGKDIAFTYGPLGFLLTPYLYLHAEWLRLITDLVLCSTVVVGICLWAWHLPRIWRWPLLTVFAFLAANADPRSELLLYVGLLAWGAVCLGDSREKPLRLILSLLIFSALAVFASLAKATFPFVAGFTVAMLSIDIILRGKLRLGLLFPVGFALALLLGWMAAGQNPLNLPLFLANTISISRSYDQAMGNQDFPLFVWAAVSMVLLTLVVLTVDGFCTGNQEAKATRGRRIVKCAWLFGLVFVVWKLGFVQVGRDHGQIFLGFMATLALSSAALPGRPKLAKWLAASAATACCLTAISCSQWLMGETLRSWSAKPFRLFVEHVTVLLKPGHYLRRLEELQDSESSAAQLPKLRERIGNASVDVFGFNQAYAILNQLNFRPRPVFQSYAAYNERLMRLNEQFYSSSAAPDFVLFQLTPIFDRFPPLEDALVLRRLLLDYRPVDSEGPFILLKAQEQIPPSLEVLREGTLRPGDLLSMRDWLNSDIWISLEMQPTLPGSIRSFFYKPPKVELGVWMFEGAKLKMAKFSAPPAMLAAGFLANPLELENQDIMDLYVGKNIARAVAYSLELPARTKSLWQDSVHYRVYRIEKQLGRTTAPGMLRLVEYPGFEATPEQVVSAGEHKITSVGGKPALLLIGGGFLQFRIPAEAKFIKGNFGFAAAAYLLGGGTAGAEFRIEEQYPDGHVELLYSQVLKPLTTLEDRGMKHFEIACPGSGERHLLLRAVPIAGQNPARDWTCWSEIGFRQ
jgi:hypothetical protein